MADETKFAAARAAQFGDRMAAGSAPDNGHCAACEAMLADALDGTLTAEDLALFEAHMAGCAPCSSMLADARRGHAWLEMLRDPRPEPPAALLERILAQTSGLAAPVAVVPALAHAEYVPAGPARAAGLPLRERFAQALRGHAFAQVLLQPRLAMTAAMAFFSIALTMNLTGVRLSELSPSDLRPASIKRDFYAANARVVQYYEGLRVVYELESRVHDLETDSDSSGTPAGQTAPAPAEAPATGAPAQPEPEKKPAPKGPGSSRRENLLPGGRMVTVGAAQYGREARQKTWSDSACATERCEDSGRMDVRKERALA